MNKGLRLIKKMVALILVLLLSIENFAAVVGDNDGAAFITKAEFDSLKNDFQSQIDQYNTSIDAKIDGAIASYLAGINIATTQSIDALVTNYSDIIWKNDLWVKIRTRKWTATNSFTDGDLKWQKPVFADYRLLRAGRFYMSPMYYIDIRPYFFTMSFINSSNDYWMDCANWFNIEAGSVDEPYHQHAVSPLVFRCYDKKNNLPVLNESGNVLQHELQMKDRGYPSILNGPGAWTTFYNNWTSGSYGPGPDGGLILQTPNAGEILRFKLKWTKYTGDNYTPVAGTTYWEDGDFYMTMTENLYGEPEFEDFYTVNVDRLRNEVFSFVAPRYQTIWENTTQQNNDIANINTMFLATTTDTKVNCATELSTKGPSKWINYDYSDSELKTATFETNSIGISYNARNWVQEFFKFKDDTGAAVTASLDLPIWPQYYLRDLYTKRFKANGQELQLGGGLPILNNALNNGNLKVKMKYNVLDADLDNADDPSQDIHISFKKSSFNDGVTNNYCTDDGGVELKNKLWEPATTATSTDYEVSIPVKLGDNVWLRLGPKDTNANGLYAKIVNLDVTLESE